MFCSRATKLFSSFAHYQLFGHNFPPLLKYTPDKRIIHIYATCYCQRTVPEHKVSKMRHSTSKLPNPGKATFNIRRDVCKNEVSKSSTRMMRYPDPTLVSEKHNDPDVFGTLAEAPIELLSDDDEDKGEETGPFLKGEERPVNIHQMKRLLKEGKLKEALTMFRKDIMQEKKAKVIIPMYIILIGACGRAGYTKMAFKLFKEMRDRGYYPTGAVITALFNACAECPFPKYGLKKAYNLCEWIEDKGFCLNSLSYHAKMKAFGRCGDLEMAFQTIDEMMEQRLPLSSKTFSFLLMACISNKEAGLSHAIQVIRKMRKYRIARDVHTYNLLLRATRDCNVGPPEVVQELLNWESPIKKKNRTLIPSKPMLTIKSIMCSDDDGKESNNQNEPAKLLDDRFNVNSVENASDDPHFDCNFGEQHKRDVRKLPDVSDCKIVLPNLLALSPSPSTALLGLNETGTPQNRLALIGGMDGVLAIMSAENVQPDIKTFSLLLEMIPSSLESEKSLLSAIQTHNVKPDVDFFNLLIKKRTFRNEFNAALDVLLQMQQFDLLPDIVTFGVLATGCRTSAMAKKLLSDMENAGFQPNIEIIGALMNKALFAHDFWYIIDVMNITKSQNIKPDPKLLDMLERARQRGENIRKEKERGEPIPPQCASQNFDKAYRMFRLYYKQWLQNMEVEIPQHPWKQYTPE